MCDILVGSAREEIHPSNTNILYRGPTVEKNLVRPSSPLSLSLLKRGEGEGEESPVHSQLFTDRKPLSDKARCSPAPWPPLAGEGAESAALAAVVAAAGCPYTAPGRQGITHCLQKQLLPHYYCDSSHHLYHCHCHCHCCCCCCC